MKMKISDYIFYLKRNIAAAQDVKHIINSFSDNKEILVRNNNVCFFVQSSPFIINQLKEQEQYAIKDAYKCVAKIFTPTYPSASKQSYIVHLLSILQKKNLLARHLGSNITIRCEGININLITTVGVEVSIPCIDINYFVSWSHLKCNELKQIISKIENC